MTLDIRPCYEGRTVEFAGRIDLSGFDFSGLKPFAEPVAVSGKARDHAGVVELDAVASTNLHLVCDRCAEPFMRELSMPLSVVLADSLSNPDDAENESIVVVDNGFCELDEIVVPALILEIDMKNLCREDCEGLCPVCGENLNYGRCGCIKKAVDPRLAKLGEYFNKQGNQ